MNEPARTGAEPGRVLVAVYTFVVVAAGARAGVQIATRFSHARLAYLLSALAAAIYLLATVALAGHGRTARRLAYLACTLELAGVVTVGTLSLLDRTAFPDPTVGPATAADTDSSPPSYRSSPSYGSGTPDTPTDWRPATDPIRSPSTIAPSA